MTKLGNYLRPGIIQGYAISIRNGPAKLKSMIVNVANIVTINCITQQGITDIYIVNSV